MMNNGGKNPATISSSSFNDERIVSIVNSNFISF
ncbi:hypothetical protein DERF_004024 [Dermatophagoides farinae]|uniref:Uncharacterized protein n=1 Tax=Dermatophagoides farinae TaxID=6954 RepID=A0A922LB63_DERFA|nr:hypothetical protein DERF_004024 [Dermatophagoides farinae]